jgi:major membrane immunogen (membrane-anchored lipoprotein)
MNKGFVLALCSMVLLASCSKDDPQPTAYESQAKLLAGEKGKSKTWKLVSIIVQENGGTPEMGTIEPCLLDNNYVFSNNDNQTYTSDEGLTKCVNTDPSVIESGNWSFTSNGKILIVVTSTFTSTTVNNGLFYNYRFPSEITTLTDASMTAKMTITSNTDVVVITFTFAKV